MQETHLLIDFGRDFEYNKLKKCIENKNLKIQNYIEHPKLENKIETMSKFYNVHVDDNRGETDFNIYIIIDT